MTVVMPRQLRVGSVADEFTELCRAHEWQRVAVIVGSGVANATSLPDRLTQGAGEVRWFERGRAHADVDGVEAMADLVKDFQPDVLVSGGGGSSHDTAKGVATLLGLGGSLTDHFLEFVPPTDLRPRPLPGPKVPIVAVPTTMSGSEGNGAAGFTPGSSDRKRVIADPSLAPTAVIIDAALIRTTPAKIYAGSMMNALNHCVEGLASRRQQETSQLLLRATFEALGALASTLAVRDLDTAELERGGIASALTGAGLSGTWLGVAHAIGHVIGARYRVPHGWVHAAIAGRAIRWNADVAGRFHARAAAVLGIEENSDSLAAWMEERAEALDLPRTLAELGVDEPAVPQLAAAVWSDHDTYFNPRRPEAPEELEELLQPS